MKYKEERKTGKVVDDNIESPMDKEFLEFQMEKSTEGLSESIVQFMVQTVFFVTFIYIALESVGVKTLILLCFMLVWHC